MDEDEDDFFRIINVNPSITLKEAIPLFYHSVVDPLKRNISSWNWKFWLFFYGFIPLILLGIAQLPQDLKNKIFILDVYNPTLFTLYLSNFTHSEIIHISNNIAVYIIFMTMIFLFESRKENLKYLSAAFLTVLPFFISILSVLFLGSIDRTIPPCQGFSGILAAFIGYGLYLLTKWSYGCFAHPFISNWDSIKKSMKIGGIIELSLVCAILAYLLDFGYNFGEFTANGGILANGIAHFGGFIIGIIVPLILGIVHDYKSRSNLVFSSIFILYTGIALFRYSQYIVELYRSIH